MTPTAKKLWALPAIGLATALAAVNPAGAAPSRAQGFVIVARELGTGSGRLVATGPIHGVGTDTVVAHVANPDGTFTDTDQFDLPGGQVELTDTYTATFSFDPDSCRYDIDVSGTWEISGSSGRYAGATGSGTFTARGLIVTGRDATGTCLALDAVTEPVAYTEIARGTGTASLP